MNIKYTRKRHGRMLLKDKLFGDRNSSTIHDHVILPKKLTDEFYSTWTQCYEELFHASLSPKYTQRKDSATSRMNKRTTTQFFGNGLRHSVSDLHLAENCNEPMTRHDERTRRANHRLSLDITSMNFDDFNKKDDDAAVFRRHQRHMSEPEPLKYAKNASSSDKANNFGKFFGAFNGRKKVYKLSESLASDIKE